MRFGVREICDVVFRAKSKMTLGKRTFYKDEPVIYFDTLKTSSLEGASTTVYAQGGRGNARLIAWEGERTLTFNMEDALISLESLSILAASDLIAATTGEPIYVHTTSQVEVKEKNTIKVPAEACWTSGKYAHDNADIFCMVLDSNGKVAAEPCVPKAVAYDKVEDANGNEVDGTVITCLADGTDGNTKDLEVGSVVLVDYYVKKTAGAQMIEITPEIKGQNFYIEASTLFRDEDTGVDMPAEFVIPNGKVQSNFTFSMASSGDPSTFSFVVDAFPAYTKFNKTKKVLAAIQVIDEAATEADGKREPCSPL